MRILLIHGRAQGGLSADKLSLQWKESIRSGLMAAQHSLPRSCVFDFPYYGDLLDECVCKYFSLDTSSIRELGDGSRFIQLEQFLRNVIPEMDIDNDGIVEDAPTNELGPAAWAISHKILKQLDTPSSTKFLLELALTDVYLYLYIPLVKEKIDELVREKITEEPTVIIAHSLGSIIAYNLIQDIDIARNIRGLITIGSPLGISAVSNRLKPLINTLPAGRWFNAFDKRDVVALNPLDGEYFPVDEKIRNSSSLVNETPLNHGAEGYLSSPVVAKAINEFVTELE